MSNKTKSIKKNFIYNLLFQIFLVIVPIAVTPYLSRILQSDGVGKYSYSSSIVSYFTLFAALGFSYYAQRAIAESQDDKEKQSIIFWEIFIIRFLSTLISFLALILVSFLVPSLSDYRTLLIILSTNVLSVGIDTTFIFQGNEDFKQILSRNVIAKAITIIAVFAFVKTRDDLWVYALIQGLSPIATAIMMIPFLRKYLVKVKIGNLHPLRHLAPCLKLFVPAIAVSVYRMIDKTMIGAMVQGETTVIVDGVAITKKIADIENGYYGQAEKIIVFLAAIATSLGAVSIPRNAFYYSEGQIEKVRSNVYTGLKFAYFLAMPLFLGTISVASNFAPWFFGEGYEKVPLLMMVFSPIILAKGLTNVFGEQYLIPSNQDMKYTISIVVGAVINLILNSILILFYQSVGAAIASVCAEFLILFVQIFMLRKTFKPVKVIACGWKYCLSALIMFVPCYFAGKFLESSILNTFLIVLIGVVVYGICLLLLKDEFVFETVKKTISKIRSKKAKSKDVH